MILVLPIGLGALGGAALGFWGQRSANKQNLREAERTRAFQAQQAGRQMDFQERMRNTSWQAAVADMEAAGINPAVAYSMGGAAAPAGAMGSGSQAAAQQDTVASALQGSLMAKDLKLRTEQIRQAAAAADRERALADVETARTRYLTQGRRGQVGPTGPPMLRELVTAEVAERIASAARTGSLAEIAGVGGQVAEGFENVLPGYQRIMRVAGEGTDKIADTVEFLERVARMRDDAVLKYFGLPKQAVEALLRALKSRGGN